MGNKCTCQGGWMCPQCSDSLRTENAGLQRRLDIHIQLRDDDKFCCQMRKETAETNKRLMDALDRIGCGWNKSASVLAEEARLALKGGE